MNTKYDSPNTAPKGSGDIVYVRAVPFADLPEDVRQKVPGVEALYALHNEDGARLALVKDRDLAFRLARQNDLAPVSVH